MTTEFRGLATFFHPRGPQVQLPVPADPVEALSHVSLCLDAGWLAAAPGLEHGEQREDVGYVLRGQHEDNGQITPFLLLYDANEGHSYSFLKVYLNTDEDIAAFERAGKIRLGDLKEYVGNDKPERGKSSRTDAFIVKARKPFGVIMKNNPKYNEDAKAMCAGKGEVYKIPRRLFVRWADISPVAAPTADAAPPVQSPAPSTNGAAKPATPTQGNGATQKPKDSGKQATASTEKTYTPDQAHTMIVEGFRAAKDRARLTQWATWAKGFRFEGWQTDEQADVYQDAYDRINAKPMEKPPMGKDAPF